MAPTTQEVLEHLGRAFPNLTPEVKLNVSLALVRGNTQQAGIYGKPQAAARPVVGGTATEQRVADLVSRGMAQALNSDPEIAVIRTSLIGSPEPLSPAAAWRLLGPHRVGAGRGENAVEYPNSTGKPCLLNLPPPLDSLKIWAAWLVSGYGWTEPESAKFIMTGEGPTPPAVAARIRSNIDNQYPAAAKIVLSAFMHVSPESIAATYTAATRQALRAGGRGPVGARRAARLAFVIPRRAAGETFKKIAEEWRVQTGEDYDWRNMARDLRESRPRKAALRGAGLPGGAGA